MFNSGTYFTQPILAYGKKQCGCILSVAAVPERQQIFWAKCRQLNNLTKKLY